MSILPDFDNQTVKTVCGCLLVPIVTIILVSVALWAVTLALGRKPDEMMMDLSIALAAVGIHLTTDRSIDRIQTCLRGGHGCQPKL